MHDTRCFVPNCTARPYAPAGTQSICKDHFLNFLTWRRRRGPQMFMKYAAMSMPERDTIAAESGSLDLLVNNAAATPKP